MASPCNTLNVQTIKVSSLAGISGRSPNVIKPYDSFLLIQNGDSSSSTKKYSRQVTFQELSDFIGSNPTGSYSGSFTGSAKGHFTGSFTGSFRGYVSASAAFSNKAAFYGTASWAKNANHALTADTVIGSVTGTGVADQFSYWTGGNTQANIPFVRVDQTTVNKGTAWPDVGVPWGSTLGRTVLYRPLAVNNYTGQHLIQYSASVNNINYLYEIGLQPGSNYLRTGGNFALYYSGSFNQNTSLTPPKEKDCAWKPDGNDSPTGGWTTMGVRGRLFGIGHFQQSNNVQAQCHVHLNNPYGFPKYYKKDETDTGDYDYLPTQNVWLATSGSAFTKLARLSGSGQFDVAGDIVSFSTFASSDERLKSEIEPLENGYEKIDSLNPVSFIWNSNGVADFGLIAQEVEAVYPEFVREDMNGYKVVKYNSFIPLLIKTVQEQQQQIALLAQKIADLEAR